MEQQVKIDQVSFPGAAPSAVPVTGDEQIVMHEMLCQLKRIAHLLEIIADENVAIEDAEEDQG